MHRLRTVALVAREAGLATLERSLLTNPAFDLVAVAAHRQLPRSEDPMQGERPEFAAIARACGRAEVKLFDADTRSSAGELEFLDGLGPIDLLVSVSWRYILSAQALARGRVGAVNLHRGELPAFAGAEPVRRMIEAGREHAVITAHWMVAKVDAGPPLATVQLAFRDEEKRGGHQAVESVKRRLLPLYGPLLDLAVAALQAGLP